MNAGTAADPLTLSDSDEHPQPTGSAIQPIDLLGSDDDNEVAPRKATRIVPTPKQSARKTSTSTNAPSSSKSSGATHRAKRPILPPTRTVNLTPTAKPSSLTGFETALGPSIKFSPLSASKNAISQVRPVRADSEGSSLSEVESEQVESESDVYDEYDDEDGDEDDDEDMDVTQKMRDSPITPSRQSLRKRLHLNELPTKSIGSSSPLLRRLREQRSKEDVATKLAPRRLPQDDPPPLAPYADDDEDVGVDEQAEVAKLEKRFEKFHEAMRDDHAATVRWLLHDNRVAIEDREPLFMDKVSPFASMETAYYVPGSALPASTTTTKLESYFNKKNVGKRHVKVITRTITDDAPKVPQYYSYTTVRRNILSANEERLKFIPFLGDIDESKKNKSSYNRLVTEIHNAYTAEKDKSGRNRESLAQIRAYLDNWLRELDLGVVYQQLVRYFLDEDDEDIELESKERHAIVNAAAEVPMTREVVRICSRLSQAFGSVFKHSLKEVIFRDEKLKETIEQKKSNSDNTATPSEDVIMDGMDDPIKVGENRIGTYAETGCLICGAVWCQTHGDYRIEDKYENDSAASDSDETKADIDDFRPLIMRYGDLLRKQDVRLAQQKPDLDLAASNESPCSENCYRVVDSSHMEYELSSEDLTSIRSMTISLRGKKRRPCDISFLLDLPCWQVDNEINQLEPRAVEAVSPGRKKGIDWYNNQTKVLKSHWQDTTQAHDHELRGQANPCAHDGPCLSSCQCYNNNILCESLCGCSDDCPRKWTGCSCHASGILCITDSCICIQMNRECGPQCVSCGAVYRINPANRHHDEMFATGCQNVSLQRGVARKVVMGESQLAGFGLYLAEPVKKGQFLLEYAGEVVSHNEAERRGIFYDRKLVSFLFDLNSEWVIDAARFGNSSRFINHAEYEKDGLNCEAKIVLVNGEHRIKFVALRDLRVGEELLFNYGKKFAEKHGLSKKLPKPAKGEGKGALVVGDENLEALDGIGLERRVTRRLATRGGARAGSGRKARKTAKAAAAAAAAVVEEAVDHAEDVDMLMGGDEQEEDDDDDRERRRKRKITRPARYTR